MNDLLLIFAGIIILFFLLLIAKSISKKKFCAICVSISGVWLVLLMLYHLEFFNNQIILAILIGQSVVGIYYLLEKKVSEKLQIFRLPTLLTLTLIAYLLIDPSAKAFPVLILLAMLWLLFLGIYAYRNNETIGKFARKIIECCKSW